MSIEHWLFWDRQTGVSKSKEGFQDFVLQLIIGPLLDDRLKENLKQILKPWKGVICFHFRVCPSVRPSVCAQATEHTFWTYNFWTEGSFGHEKETHFFVLRNFQKIASLGSFLVFCSIIIYYLIFVGHIIWITVFGLFAWYQFAYQFRLKWLMLIDRTFLWGQT